MTLYGWFFQCFLFSYSIYLRLSNKLSKTVGGGGGGGGGGGQDQLARHKPLTLYTYPTSSSTSLALLETSAITFMTLLQGICVHKLQLSINSVRVYSNTAGCDKSHPYVPKVCQYYGLILLFFPATYHLPLVIWSFQAQVIQNHNLAGIYVGLQGAIIQDF
jgi:hypothetical protein